MDTVDFGGKPAGLIKGRLGLTAPAEDLGRLVLRNSQNVKDKKKRWHEDKSAPCKMEASSSPAGVEALMGALSARQPSLATIVGRAHEASVSSERRARSTPLRQRTKVLAQ